jgi:hypothetical protein
MIKKRVIKGNIRKKSEGSAGATDGGDGRDDRSSDDEGEGVNTAALADVKYQQSKRKRTGGVVFDPLADTEGSAAESSNKRSGASKEIAAESAVSSQYVVRLDTGLSELKHEKLMEKYVLDKLEGKQKE